MSDLERKLYVCGLPQDINEGELKDVFGVYGRLEEVVVLPAKPGTGVDRPDRTGFVKFIEKDEASAAMAILHDMYKFRDASVDAIRVSWARSNRDNRDDSKGSKGGCSGGKGGSMPPVLAPPPAALPPPPAPAPGGKGCGGFSGGKGSAPAGGEKLWVGNLPGNVSDAEMHKVFGQYGTVDDISILPAKSRSGQLCAFVRFSTVAEADACIAGMAGFKFHPGDAEEVKVERPSVKKGGKGDAGSWGGKGDGKFGGKNDGNRYQPY
eukprot:TRINITY_DN91876_c0_g1_i1.p1 TRINITY_DN91876_c0_g1~~TRINITY_DN91876_c0_g1_i1.p1  ORF type:complete len:265 (+),score=74.69 TRINITY_DN91876_c0_g1_i1:65-859(+)